ncbi:4-hydroxy-tetrahydrodipicolinate synthase [Candidatus Paracaedibacter symbiosus]|uniref:4-hydroxy-tetrahydrodipicolinate synthase n=1 Tax=Candidatus Paracaedibacter symbiosus TaxID=244582 RepID=UPI0009FC1B9E|nr:4-hydroxy-tetrahydrodipicolinate synthase [Candidatus Paracaedibacter symbiosus]
MFSGSIVALITPFLNGEIDLTAIKKLVNWHVDQGTNAIVACGSTGEAALLNNSERRLVIETVIRENDGRLPIIVGCGAPSTHEVMAMMREAKELGADAALVVTPYYVKPTPEGIFQHFKALNEAVELPIIIYNNPGRAVVGLSVELVVRLAELTNVVGIKDSCEDLTRVIKMRQQIKKPFSFLSGDDPIATAYLAHGGDGVISVSANVVPKLCSQMVAAWKQRDLDLFSSLRDKLLPLHEAMFVEANPAPAKYVMSQLQLITEEVRLPLVPVSAAARQKLDQVIKSVGLIALKGDSETATQMAISYGEESAA